MLRTWIVFFLLLGAWAAMADTEQMIIPSQESVSPETLERKVVVPPFSVEHQVRLILEARIEWPRLSGSNPWIRVALNGSFLTSPDLLNKRNEFKVRSGVDLTWAKGDRWRVLYSPDFESAVKDKDNAYACPDADPYRYVWDITRYVHPGENMLRIEHLQVLAKPDTLILRNVKIEVGRPISPPKEEAVDPAPTGLVPTFVAKGPQRVPMDVVLRSEGGLRLSVAGKSLEVSTRISLPGGAWHEAGQKGTETPIASGASSTVTLSAPAWKIERLVSVHADHVSIADTISNPGRDLLGVMIRHRVQTPEQPDFVRLAGTEALSRTSRVHNANHPSAFAKWKELGVGLVAEDDVFRVHALSFSEPDAVGIADDQLGIEPGASVTLEWSIYPVPAGDYWDFVNAVRRNWDTNFPIPGPFCFTMAFRAQQPAQWYGDWVRSRGLKIVCGGIAKYPAGKYAHGTGILFAPEWVAQEKDWTRKMISAAPEVKVLAYFHAHCCTEPDGENTYADSRLIDGRGEHIGYPYHYRLPLYLPTRDNSYGKALWGYIRTCLDEIGTSGLYWDEMSHSVLHYAYQCPWDGRTVIIDPKTHAVSGKRSVVPLLTQPLRLDIVKYLRDRGKFLMANTQPVTRTMMREKIVRFVETGSYSAMINTHLGCPLGLGNHHLEKTQADAARNVRELLRYGGVYYGWQYERDPVPWNFTDVMFPITPVEIREGVVFGEERIHAARSGRFGWPDGAAAEVHVVDGEGGRVAAPNVREVHENGRRLYEIRMPSDHFAVLVKRQR